MRIQTMAISHLQSQIFCLSYNRHHHSPYPTPTALLLKEDSSFSPEFEIIPLKQHTIPKVPFFDYLNAPRFCIMQSCNGLFLCLSKSNQIWSYGQDYNYYICNPATKQFKSLSFPSSEFKKSLVSVCMAFNTLKSNHYKLICVRKVKNKKKKYQIDVYSSETDSWSPLGITFTPPYPMDDAKPVYCNGIVHWYIEDEAKTSLYFDVDRECLKKMPMPNLTERVVQYFGESQGRLHLIVTEDPFPLQFDVLEMAADYSGWFVRFHVILDAVRTAFSDIIWYDEGDHTFSVLQVIRAQKEEDSIVVIYVDNEAISYNVHNGYQKSFVM